MDNIRIDDAIGRNQGGLRQAAVNLNEIVVRTLLDALAGKAEIQLVGRYAEHTYVDALIGPLKVTFWKRMFLRRVAQVNFPDGETIDYEEAETVPDPWVPPKQEFPKWWRMMGADEARSEEELAEDHHQLMMASRQADKEGRTKDAKRLRTQWRDTWDRTRLYNPLFYLTEAQQEQLESILRGQIRPKA